MSGSAIGVEESGFSGEVRRCRKIGSYGIIYADPRPCVEQFKYKRPRGGFKVRAVVVPGESPFGNAHSGLKATVLDVSLDFSDPGQRLLLPNLITIEMNADEIARQAFVGCLIEKLQGPTESPVPPG